MYSITTTTGQGKGNTTPPARAPFPQTYSDNFASYPTGTLAKYFSDINGGFDTASCAAGRSGTCYEQMITQAPIAWMNSPEPITVIGDNQLSNYQVKVDAMLEQAGAIDLDANIVLVQQGSGVNGYHLKFESGGNWTLFKENGTANTVLASGTTTFGVNTWHTISLSTTHGMIQATIDGTTLASVTDTTYTSGLAGLQVDGWQNAQFDNFSLTPTANEYTYYELLNVNSGQALDVKSGSPSNGGLIDQFPVDGATSQQWQLVSVNGGYKVINRKSGLMLEDPGKSTTHGTQLDQWSSNGGDNQWWYLVMVGNTGSYTLVNQYNGLFADVAGASTAWGASVIQWPGNGGTNQEWQLVAVA